MSPARARTSREAIIAEARRLLEESGLDAVTMQAVADRVGIRAPSLYKRFAGRSALIGAIAEDVVAELGRTTAPATRVADPGEAVRIAANNYRAFAHGSPGAYKLLFSRLIPQARPTAESNAAGAADVLLIAERLVGIERAIEAARLLTAFVHGFVSMEIAGAFRLGGDVDRAFRYSLDAIIAGAQATTEAARVERDASGSTWPP
jgi:AcrR family transcriptional regulator